MTFVTYAPLYAPHLYPTLLAVWLTLGRFVVSPIRLLRFKVGARVSETANLLTSYFQLDPLDLGVIFGLSLRRIFPLCCWYGLSCNNLKAPGWLVLDSSCFTLTSYCTVLVAFLFAYPSFYSTCVSLKSLPRFWSSEHCLRCALCQLRLLAQWYFSAHLSTTFGSSGMENTRAIALTILQWYGPSLLALLFLISGCWYSLYSI
jgi:hypothetical protein